MGRPLKLAVRPKTEREEEERKKERQKAMEMGEPVRAVIVHVDQNSTRVWRRFEVVFVRSKKHRRRVRHAHIHISLAARSYLQMSLFKLANRLPAHEKARRSAAKATALRLRIFAGTRQLRAQAARCCRQISNCYRLVFN